MLPPPEGRTISPSVRGWLPETGGQQVDRVRNSQDTDDRKPGEQHRGARSVAGEPGRGDYAALAPPCEKKYEGVLEGYPQEKEERGDQVQRSERQHANQCH